VRDGEGSEVRSVAGETKAYRAVQTETEGRGSTGGGKLNGAKAREEGEGGSRSWTKAWIGCGMRVKVEREGGREGQRGDNEDERRELNGGEDKPT
jgi:hypothetical protein